MIVSNLTSPTVIAGSVWSAATRTLTGLGNSVGGPPANVHTSLANGASQDFRPSTTGFWLLLVVNEATLNASFLYKLNNGTNTSVFLTVASNTSGSVTIPLEFGTYLTLTNNGTAGGFYGDTGIAWNQ